MLHCIYSYCSLNLKNLIKMNYFVESWLCLLELENICVNAVVYSSLRSVFFPSIIYSPQVSIQVTTLILLHILCIKRCLHSVFSQWYLHAALKPVIDGRHFCHCHLQIWHISYILTFLGILREYCQTPLWRYHANFWNRIFCFVFIFFAAVRVHVEHSVYFPTLINTILV